MMKKHRAHFAFGLTALGGLVALNVVAQAQTAVERQVLAPGRYQMPLGIDLTSESRGPREHTPRLSPVDQDELTRQKNSPAEGVRSGVESTLATQRDPDPEAVQANCTANVATTSTPSDIHGAAGPTNFVAVTNSDIGVYNKTNCAIVSRVSFRTFFSASFAIPSTQSLFDPRVLFDPSVGRFFVAIESRDSGGNDQFQYFAVSTDGNGTAWNQYRLALSQGATLFCKRNAATFWDYPQAGFNGGGGATGRWFIAASDFSSGPISTTRGTVLSIEKAPTLTGAQAIALCFNDLIPTHFAPPLVQDGTATGFFLASVFGGNTTVRRFQLTPIGSGAGMADTFVETSAITIPAWAVPPDAAQPNGQRLDSLDGRFQSASIQNGSSLWNVHSVNNGGFARWRLYRFSTTDTAPLFTFSTSTTGNDHLFNPSVATNATTAFVTASRTIPSDTSGAGNAAMLIFSGPNSSASGWTFDLIATSAAQYQIAGTAAEPNTPCNNTQRGSCRWGDYSATQIDPTNGSAAWGFNQLITSTTSFDWITRAALVGAPPPPPPPPGPPPQACALTSQLGDFNADGRDDLLFRRAGDGLITQYLLNGFQIVAASVVGTVGPEWGLAAVADFDGDGRADLLFRRADGILSLVLLNGSQIVSSQVIGTVGIEFDFVGAADFNGDGRADMLFRRNSDGMLALFLMNGFQILDAQLLGIVGPEWRVRGVRDFNGDGRADILFRRSGDGMISLFLFNGFQNLGAALIGQVGVEWNLLGVRDFNGDGRADMLFRRGDGTLSLFLMNGFQVLDAQLLGTVGIEFALLGLGDVNGDGRSDMVFRRDSDGLLSIFLMNGFQVLDAQFLGNVGPEFLACYGQPPLAPAQVSRK